MSDTPAPAALLQGIDRLQTESGGLISVIVLQQDDMPDLFADVLAGDREAAMVFAAVTNALALIDAAPRRSPKLCVACPRPLRKGRFGLGLVLAERPDPTVLLALAVCRHCGTSHAVIEQHAIAGLRRVWPDLRRINLTNRVGGHA